MITEAARVLIPSATAFALGILFAPFLANILYKHKAWKKKSGKGHGMGGGGTPIFDELHREREVSTPRMGGILVWAATLATAAGFFGLSQLFGQPFSKYVFLDRSQTWLPLFALVAGGIAGMVDDLLEIRDGTGGLSLSRRLSIVGGIGFLGGAWFYAKLGVTTLGIPFSSPVEIGWGIIPLFTLVTLAIYAGGTIDGLDGLAGGVFAFIFMTYAGIAFTQAQLSLAAFAASLAGACFAFLWFNVPPARFYLSETGSMALTLALATTAFTADALGGGVGVLVLPVIAFPLTMTVITTVLQVFSKKIFKKKIFRVAPVHHHFEALGWSAAKVTMRYWIITIIAGVLGLSLALLGAAK